ncbi:hypothetical protein H9635_06400 [Solibacillus sp. A46]|uniref:Uncharacterized protein n=1 Tax=Solibacillus faecavium TaxID=2762221 RepID=A0ABR8XWV2_9BACL|nr:hypothetical protein [Solibacillus faecavium]MBD8036368.1 hypothetical protein [Solibacillus faecavium]
MEIIITIGVVIIAISCLSIDAKLKENGKRDKEIIALLKEINQKNKDIH